jgi:hypothetical protein
MKRFALLALAALLPGCLALPTLDAMGKMPDKSGAAQCVAVTTAAGRAVLVSVRVDDELDRPPNSVHS